MPVCIANAGSGGSGSSFRPDLSGKTDPVTKLIRQADQLSKTNPTGAEPLYRKALEIAPGDYYALIGLGDCREKISGDPKDAVPYYRKALFVPATGNVTSLGAPAATWFNDALLFEEAGELADSVKLYNKGIEEINAGLDWRAKNSKIYTSDKGVILTPYTPVLLPVLTEKSTFLDVAANAHLGLGLTEEVGEPEKARVDFEAALNIKKTPEAEHYFAKFRGDHPNLFKDEKPSK